MRISLPFPPPSNNLFVNIKRGRAKSQRYKDWISIASTRIKDSHRQAIGPYSMTILLRRPDKRKRDIANLEKAVSDLLVSHGVLQDDSLCERLLMQWDAGMEEECVVIIKEFGGAEETDYIQDALKDYIGDRCPDFDPDCHCCMAWVQYDSLVELT